MKNCATHPLFHFEMVVTHSRLSIISSNGILLDIQQKMKWIHCCEWSHNDKADADYVTRQDCAL